MEKTKTHSATDVPPFDAEAPEELETAQFALGCFWGPDAQFGVVPGVWRTRVGYAGGSKANPTYHSLGDHIETIQVDYDPAQVSYEELLDLFWMSHRPDRPSMKRQYMSAIFALGDEQERLARETKERVAKELGSEVATEIMPASEFHLAEDYHQKYRLRQAPRLMEDFDRLFASPDAFTHSPTAARVNGYVAGHGRFEQLQQELDRFALSADAQERLRKIVRRSS